MVVDLKLLRQSYEKHSNGANPRGGKATRDAEFMGNVGSFRPFAVGKGLGEAGGRGTRRV